MPTTTPKLVFWPDNQQVDAQIVPLTADLAERQIRMKWWNDESLLEQFDPVPSGLNPGKSVLLVERLFTAPRNRTDLRQDGKPLFRGVGTNLLIWAARTSRDMGFEGRLRLDSSPAEVSWYENRIGLQKLEMKPIVFEGVEYTPMELPDNAAQRLCDELR
jgi:hypothetical protein